MADVRATPRAADDLAAKRLAQAALAYAERLGWHVFPLHNPVAAGAELACSCPRGRACGSAGKHPRTPRGVKDASADPRQIRTWWRRWPLANVGIACQPSGLVVLDVDPRNGGLASLAAIVAEHGALPPTAEARSGGGGPHYYFRRPTIDGKPAPRAKSTSLGAGLDLKADGGYLVAAPSAHVSTGIYSWQVKPTDTPPAELPAWILARLDTRAVPTGANGAATAGLLGAAFAAAGWLGRAIAADRAAVRCPWEDGHSTGTRYDSSTVVFGPTAGRDGIPAARVGAFHCSHGSCSQRTLRDVLTALPSSALATARKQLDLPPGWLPGSNGSARGETLPETPADMTPGGEPTDEDAWHRGLSYSTDKDGNPRLRKTALNASLLVSNRPEWQGAFVRDDFARCIYVARPLPSVPGLAAPTPGERCDRPVDSYVRAWLQFACRVEFSREDVADAVSAAASANPRHPLREYLDALHWDGTTRIESWLADYLGAEPTPYHSLVGRWWLVSAVARAYQPGCQVDHMLVLEGAQGTGKTQTCRALAIEEDWYLEHLPDLRDKDSGIVLAGHWITEVAELDAFRGQEQTRIKEYLTRVADTYRTPYAKGALAHARSCVFVGTTNDAEYLRDWTGARRFWPVAMTRLDRDALLRDRAQLWAEAVVSYQNGERWWPVGSVESDAILLAQETRTAHDEWESLVATRAVAWATADSITLADALEAVDLDPGKWTHADQQRVGRILRKLGYRRFRSRASSGGISWRYRRSNLPARDPVE